MSKAHQSEIPFGGEEDAKNLPAISSSMKRAKNSTLTFARDSTLMQSRVLFLARFIDEEIAGRFSASSPPPKGISDWWAFDTELPNKDESV